MNSLTRRRALQGGAALTALTIGVAPPASAAPFADADVRRTARDLAKHPFQEPYLKLPGAAGSMTYDQYRGIRFRQDRALWHGQNLPFQVGFFPRGFLYRPRVDVFEVTDGQATPVPYTSGLFDYDDPAVRVPDDLGFAGLRVHAAINQPGQFDEFCVFLGASYFRAVGRGQQYGLSARGLAIGTGAAEPEEFPRFRTFWLERPQPRGNSLVIHALLDGPSVTGAFRFSVRPGGTTVMDVESTLFPRTAMAQAGLAPLTSMYYFGARDHAASGRTRPDDWRTAVHDSAGLAGQTGLDQRFWRPLANPAAVQVSAFPAATPRGFGLMQRQRGPNDFGDLQVLYGRRPDLWVEPTGDWGEGSVDLVEIPTSSEYNDNIVAFWRGREPLRAGAEYSFAYRMHWGENPVQDGRLARVVDVRTGAGTAASARVFVLDLSGEAIRSMVPDTRTWLDIGASSGTLREGYSGPNPETGGWRISLEFDPAGATLADLRCTLLDGQGALSETWLHRWAA